MFDTNNPKDVSFLLKAAIGWFIFGLTLGGLAWGVRSARGDEPPRLIPIPVETRYQVPPVYPHQVPYRLDDPPYPGWEPNIPSNQDIKDGIQRPNDRLYYGCWHYFSHDYYARKK